MNGFRSAPGSSSRRLFLSSTITAAAGLASARVALAGGAAAAAPGYELVHRIDVFNEGTEPYAGLVAGPGGHLYGSTLHGGPGNAGTVFRLDRFSGAVEVVHAFGPGLAAGGLPSHNLCHHRGQLYGVTTRGGDADRGVLFVIDAAGGYRVLHVFGLVSGDGAGPVGPLVAGLDGWLYGTTSEGGAQGSGTVYALSPDTGAVTVRASLQSSATGANPIGLTLDPQTGSFFGMAVDGGSREWGTIFRFDPASGAIDEVHAFQPFDTRSPDGHRPTAPLLLARDGWFYGTTNQGGGGFARGTVFRVSRSGKMQTFHRFDPNLDGSPEAPWGGLAQGRDGLIYGTCTGGGQGGLGALFRIRPRQADPLEYVHHFMGIRRDGAAPTGTLLAARDGRIYGTTRGGGLTTSAGTIFRFGPV